MLVVETYIAKSPIHGHGVFYKYPIAKSDLIWTFNHDFDRAYYPEQIEEFPLSTQKFIYRCAFLDKRNNIYILDADYDIFSNHKDEANVVEDPNSDKSLLTPNLIAACDIRENEELTQNYFEFIQDDDIDKKFLGDVW